MIRCSYEGVAKDLAEQESWAIKNKATEKMLSQISCNLLIRRPDRGFTVNYSLVIFTVGKNGKSLKKPN